VKRIYPGINIEKFLAAPEIDVRKQMGINPGEFVVGCVGRISCEKGVHDVIRAAAILKARDRRCSVVIVGTLNPNAPGYMGELQQLIAAENVADRIHFYGFTSAIAGVMKNIDALVLASNIPEASPLVLREAMLCGKPVVSTDTGGQVEIVQDQVNGFLVPPDSPARIADALEKLITQPGDARQIGTQGQQIAMAQFTQQHMLDEIEQCYFECLHQISNDVIKRRQSVHRA
jgi:glycosyltransferase involved in cell wall biosynthesis